MSINVVIDGPQRTGGRRALRRVRSLVDGVVVLCGLIASVPAFVLGVYGLLSSFTDQGAFGWTAEPTRSQLPDLLGASVAVTVVGLVSGVLLLRSRRRLVLFLRRFGFVETTQVVTAAAHSVGRHWRLVTLDDHQIAPLGSAAASSLDTVSKGSDAVFNGAERLAKVAGGVMTIALIGAIGAIVLVYSENGQDVVWAALESEAIEAQAFRILAVLFVVALAVKIVTSLLEGAGILLLPLMIPAMFTSFVFDAAREADRAKNAVVFDAGTLETTTRAVVGYRTRVFAPRLVVIRVRSAIWQQAVGRLASAADAVLVDVSEPTENLLWEIEELARRHDVRPVFICHHRGLPVLFDETDANLLNRRLRTLLRGADVLAYQVDRAGVRRFTRALRDSLESQGSTVR